jgi:hypothetical protein
MISNITFQAIVRADYKMFKTLQLLLIQLIHYMTATADNRTSPVRVLSPPQNDDDDDDDTPLSLDFRIMGKFFLQD